MKQLNWMENDRIVDADYVVESKSWVISFASGATVRIESMWRLFEDGVICSTSFDHGEKFGHQHIFDGISALREMSQYEIKSIVVVLGSGDVKIKFKKMFELEILSTSAGFETCEFNFPNIGSFVSVEGKWEKIA